MMRAGLVGAMIFAVSFQSGCSALFVKGPPKDHAQLARFECSESNGWPVFDAIWAGLNGAGALVAAGDDMNPDQGQIVGVGLAWLAVSGISAIYGFSKVSQCKAAKRQRDERFYPEGIDGATPRGASAITPPATPRPTPAAPPIVPSPAAPVARPEPAAAPPVDPDTTTSSPAAPSDAPSAPTSSRTPSRSELRSHVAVRVLPPRSLAMRSVLPAT